MPRNVIRVWGVNLKWIILCILYPFICWALYQDMKTELPWYYIILACLLGGISGVILIVKIIESTLRFMDNKIARLLRIKE